MTLILECSLPWLWRPGRFQSRIMTRVWWGWFAVTRLHIPMRAYAETAYQWVEIGLDTTRPPR